MFWKAGEGKKREGAPTGRKTWQIAATRSGDDTGGGATGPGQAKGTLPKGAFLDRRGRRLREGPATGGRAWQNADKPDRATKQGGRVVPRDAHTGGIGDQDHGVAFQPMGDLHVKKRG